jgi:hypothetical protein
MWILGGDRIAGADFYLEIDDAQSLMPNGPANAPNSEYRDSGALEAWNTCRNLLYRSWTELSLVVGVFLQRFRAYGALTATSLYFRATKDELLLVCPSWLRREIPQPALLPCGCDEMPAQSTRCVPN